MRKTYQGKSQSPVAWRAGGRETNLLKSLDSLIFEMGASLQAVAQTNAEVAPKVSSPFLGPVRQRRGFGWKRWSRQWMETHLGLFKGYRVQRPRLKALPA